MAVKAKFVCAVKASKREWPKLMINKDKAIVLFECHSWGTVVGEPGAPNYIGFHSQDWNMADFTDLVGSVVLENE